MPGKCLHVCKHGCVWLDYKCWNVIKYETQRFVTMAPFIFIMILVCQGRVLKLHREEYSSVTSPYRIMCGTNQPQLKHTQCIHEENMCVLHASFCDFCTKPCMYVRSQIVHQLITKTLTLYNVAMQNMLCIN